MRKMYFAMIPKRSALEDAAIIAGLTAGALYGAKWLLGEEKYNEYKSSLKSKVFKNTASDFTAQGPDTGVGIADDDAAARDEESILARIRKAAKL